MTGFEDLKDDLPWAEPREAEEVAEHTHSDMRGQITDPIKVVGAILAGNATLTVVSKKTGNRLTFKFSRPPLEQGRKRPVWVKVLSGADNEGDYTFLGTIWPEAQGWNYNHKRGGAVTHDAPSAKLIQWMLKQININPSALVAQAEIWHEGRCLRCGRKLTVPSSIESGYGPECVKLA